MIVTAHQPEFMSYVGYFDKICKADKLVILDSVSYRKNYFQNRNKILGRDGEKWVTIPLEKQKLGTSIKNMKINHKLEWQKKMINTIKQSYSKSLYFDKYYPYLEDLLKLKDEYLYTFNVRFLNYFLECLDIKIEKIYSSKLNLVESKDKMVLELCTKTKASTYVAGISGKDYLNENDFKKIGVNLYHHEYIQKEYRQYNNTFSPYLSVLDLLMHKGEDAKNLLNNKLVI